MAGVIVDAFDPSQQSNGDGDPDDIYVEEQLLQMMNDEFDVVLEDGSAEAVARDIVRLWTRLNSSSNEGEKAAETIRDWEAQVAKTRGKAVQAVIQEGIEEVDAEGDEEWEDDDENEEGAAMEVDEDEAPQLVDSSRQREEIGRAHV